MAGKTLETQEPPETANEAPQADPRLVRIQQLQQQYQQTNGRLMELRQQKTVVEDMIIAMNDQAKILQGRLEELAYQQQNKKG